MPIKFRTNGLDLFVHSKKLTMPNILNASGDPADYGIPVTINPANPQPIYSTGGFTITPNGSITKNPPPSTPSIPVNKHTWPTVYYTFNPQTNQLVPSQPKETDWNEYLPKEGESLPRTIKQLIHKVGMIIIQTYFGTISTVYEVLKPESDIRYSVRVLATNDKTLKVGKETSAVDGFFTYAIIGNEANGPIKKREYIYESKPSIDLSIYKHKCTRCSSPALIMFNSVECTKCGKI